MSLPESHMQARPRSPHSSLLTLFIARLHPSPCPCSAGANNGRPKPWLSTRVAETLDAFPLWACVKVDDTLPGIAEGTNAGMWTVGVARSGNENGLSEEEDAALAAKDPDAHRQRLQAARERFVAAGANYVIDSVADLGPVLEDIEKQLAAGVPVASFSAAWQPRLQ